MFEALLAAALFGAAPQPTVYTAPAVAVGEAPPEATVLQKLTELADDVLRRAGAPEAGLAAEPGAAFVTRARAAYFDLQFQTAVDQARLAIDHYEKTPLDLGDGQRYLAARTLAAMAELELGHDKQAQEHFAAALTVRPDLHLLESDFSPSSIAALERARDQRITDRPRSSLTVTTSPAFARVRLDGAPSGEAPLTLKGLLVGRHFVSVSRDGHLPQAAWVEVTQGRGATATFVLPESPVETSRRAVARQLADGADATTLPAGAAALAKSAGADAALLLAVGRAGPRYVIVAAFVPATGRPTRAVTTVAVDLVDAPEALERVVKAVLESPEGDAVRTVGEPPPPGALDFSRAWLGLTPPPAPVLVLPPPPPPLPVTKKPWFWGLVAGGAAVIGAGVAALVVTQSATPPPGVQVHLGLPP